MHAEQMPDAHAAQMAVKHGAEAAAAVDTHRQRGNGWQPLANLFEENSVGSDGFPPSLANLRGSGR